MINDEGKIKRKITVNGSLVSEDEHLPASYSAHH